MRYRDACVHDYNIRVPGFIKSLLQRVTVCYVRNARLSADRARHFGRLLARKVEYPNGSVGAGEAAGDRKADPVCPARNDNFSIPKVERHRDMLRGLRARWAYKPTDKHVIH